MRKEIENQEISAANLNLALEVFDKCFDDEWSKARVRTDYNRYTSDEKIFFEPELGEEVRLLEYYLHQVQGDSVGLSGLYSYGDGSSRTQCWLGWFCIDPERQQNGYGTAVLEHIKERAKAIGMEELLLHTEKDNTIARSFYEKQGFVLSSEVEYWDRKLVRYELALCTT